MTHVIEVHLMTKQIKRQKIIVNLINVNVIIQCSLIYANLNVNWINVFNVNLKCTEYIHF